MTLITFQSRIHFASDVLEEALRAELEESGHKNVLILADVAQAERQLMHRIQMGLPDNVERDLCWINKGQTKYETAEKSCAKDDVAQVDAIIGFGNARAISHARKCRQAIAQSRHARLPKVERRVQRVRQFLPDFYAIPGVDGLPDPCLAGSSMAEKTTPPNVIICDPSLLSGSSDQDVANAFAITLGRCLATFTGSRFNPLADGMAVEGLRRLAMLMPLGPVTQFRGGKGRDLMAASLNGSISQIKGPGLIQAIASALTTITETEVDSASLQRILLPRLLQDLDLMSCDDEALVMKVLDGHVSTPLSARVEEMLEPLPLTRSLEKLGHGLAEFKLATVRAQDRIHIPTRMANRLTSIIEDAY
jgi:alcohol dehydrogenase class IV